MIHTVLGPIEGKEAGRILPHEHILVAFIEDGRSSPADYDQAEVVSLLLPNLIQLKEAGCCTFVDCSPEFLGRDPMLLKKLSELSGLHIVTNTGYYKSPYLAPWVYAATIQQLSDKWVGEFVDGIGGTEVKPGYVKIALNDGTINDTQQNILRAAIETSKQTGLVIQSHTVGGETAAHAAAIIREEGMEMDRFVWVHAQSGDDLSLHESLGKEGMWISIDNIGWVPYEESCALLMDLTKRGIADRILISQDTGWYQVGEPHGGTIRPYHKLFTDFIPFASERGIDPAILHQWVTENPLKAMSVRE